MPIQDASLKHLISYLQEVPKAILHDQEEETIIDSYGNAVNYEYQPWAQIVFTISNIRLNVLHQEFEDEFTNNKNINGFSYNYYLKDAIRHLTDLKVKFASNNICGLDIKVRNDFIVKYLSRDEEEIVQDVYGRQVCQPKSLILAKEQYEKLPEQILQKISEYFAFQERFLNNLLNYLNKYIKINNKRPYNKDYAFEYFKFDTIKIGKNISPKVRINSFFERLFDDGYICGSDSIENLSLYFDNDCPLLKSKVIWKPSGSTLYHLIKELNSRKYIKNAKGSWSNIILKIFIKEDGSDFTPDELYSRHPSKQAISDLKNIIRILGQ